MSPGVRRARTLRTLTQRVNTFGRYHPATFAAYARAFVAWNGRVKPPRCEDASHCGLAAAYTTAQLRAYGANGWSNRHRRKHEARRHVEAMRPGPTFAE